MGIIIFVLAVFLFWKQISKYNTKTRFVLISVLAGYIIFSLILNSYLENVYLWEYGVPGADLTYHFRAAQAISNGVSLNDLGYIADRFVLRPSNIGYIVYAYFLALVSFCPIIISINFSLQIFYAIQSIVAISSALNIAEFVSQDSRKAEKHTVTMLLVCASVAQMAVVLMRDIWVVFFISLLLNQFRKEQKNHFICIFLIICAAILRSYSIIITVPLYIAYGLKRKKLGVGVSVGVFAAFFLGRSVIDELANYMSILWKYSYNIDVGALIEYVFFPSILTQSHNVQHMVTGFHANFGGNTEWIYYILACWNCFVYPIVVYGILQLIKERRFSDTALWGLSVANIVMLYGIFYSSVSEPRHKLLLIYALAFFFAKGISKMKPVTKFCYFAGVTVLLIFLLIFIS